MIYMDNSATSYPKPPRVLKATKKAIEKYAFNVGRNASASALMSANALFDARCAIATLVGTQPENIVFTYNATYALNMAILGLAGGKASIATDRFAHNSVLRPLYFLRSKGHSVHFLDTDAEHDRVIIASLKKLLLKEKIDLLVLTHTSNTTGKVLPIRRLADMAHAKGATVILDASQGIGSSNVDLELLGVDILASSGHKGLYGMMGTGFLAIREGFRGDIVPIITGGSGIFSGSHNMPDGFPERLEAGTVGLPGAISMGEGARFITQEGIESIAEHERDLRSVLLSGLSVIPKVVLLNENVNANSIILFNVKNKPSEILAQKLDEYGIVGRAGYHCAPLAHRILSNLNPDYDGALRLSVGYIVGHRYAVGLSI